MIAPILEQGTNKRGVYLPAGTWLSSFGERLEGPSTLTVTLVSKGTLPYYIKQDNNKLNLEAIPNAFKNAGRNTLRVKNEL